ncbi:MAG: YqjD family protein, partial [Verrucomicrobium sp.]
MNNEIESTLNQLPEKAQEAAQQAADATRNALATARERAGTALTSAKEKTHEVLHTARDRANEAYGVARERTNQALHVAKDKTDVALKQSSQYVRENPLPMLLGALAVGIAVGVAIGRREEQRTFRQRLADDPVHTARDAIYAVLSPIAEKLHDQYDVARSGAQNAVDRLNSRQNRRAVDNI